MASYKRIDENSIFFVGIMGGKKIILAAS